MTTLMQDDMYIPLYDAIILGLTLLLEVVYLFVYEWRVRDASTRGTTQTGRNYYNMLLWAEKHAEKPDAPSVTLAIQTLRNTILVGVFIGGASLQYAANACDFLVRPGGPISPQLFCRELILGGLLFVSFLNWTQVIRFANHLGYWVGTLEQHVEKKRQEIRLREEAAADSDANDPDATEVGGGGEGGAVGGTPVLTLTSSRDSSPPVNVNASADSNVYNNIALKECKVIGRKMIQHFSYGLRFMYFSIPFYFYSAGPTALVVSCSLLVYFLFMFDLPRSAGKNAEVIGMNKRKKHDSFSSYV